jgi:hypothetical protein
MLHLDPAFNTATIESGNLLDTVDSSSMRTTAPDVLKRQWKESLRSFLTEVLPSVTILAAVVVWVIFSESTTTMTHANVTLATSPPTSAKPSSESGVLCTRLLNSARYTPCHSTENRNIDRFVVPLVDATLSMCKISRSGEIRALVINKFNERLYIDREGLRVLMFRQATVASRLSGTFCESLYLGHKNETVASCNNVVTMRGYPDEITLTAGQWNSFMYHFIDVMEAMLGC